MMSHMDAWPTLAAMVGIKPPPADWVDNNGKGIYFDGIDNSAYVTGKDPHSARDFVDLRRWRELLGRARRHRRRPEDPMAPNRVEGTFTPPRTHGWGQSKILVVAGLCIISPWILYEKYDMLFNGAVSTRLPTTSPGRYSGEDNGWALSLAYIPLVAFDKSIIKYPNIQRFPGGASNDLKPNLKNPKTLYLCWIRTCMWGVVAADRSAARVRGAGVVLAISRFASPHSDGKAL